MNNVHGLIYAYHMHPDLGDLCKRRTAAALPFCARFRLIDFAMSGMMNAGVPDVDVVMQYGFQSLMDHLTSGRPWNLVRHSGGMHLLLAPVNRGAYGGAMDALDSIYPRLRDDVKRDYILLTRGDLCANIDMRALIEAHYASGADITAVCTTQPIYGLHQSFLPDGNGFASDLLCRQTTPGRGLCSLETYILRREKLLEMIRWCSESNRLHFHRGGLLHMMGNGWRVGLFMHSGYARFITSIQDYYSASMEMLDPIKRAQLFPEERRVATRARSDVSTYYGDAARVHDSLVADGCIVEGRVERCILFNGVRVGPDCSLRDCIIMNNTEIGAHTDLSSVVADKDVTVSANLHLCGSARLPLVIPKGSCL